MFWSLHLYMKHLWHDINHSVRQWPLSGPALLSLSVSLNWMKKSSILLQDSMLLPFFLLTNVSAKMNSPNDLLFLNHFLASLSLFPCIIFSFFNWCVFMFDSITMPWAGGCRMNLRTHTKKKRSKHKVMFELHSRKLLDFLVLWICFTSHFFMDPN